MEAHGWQDEGHQGETYLPIQVNKAGVNTQDEHEDEQHHIVTGQDEAIEDWATLLQREVLKHAYKHGEGTHDSRHDE